MGSKDNLASGFKPCLCLLTGRGLLRSRLGFACTEKVMLSVLTLAEDRSVLATLAL